MNWYLKVLKQYADFSGRARRKEFWMFSLFNMIFSYALVFIFAAIGAATGVIELSFLSYIYSLAVFIPGLAVTVRRLHDTGKSGLYILIALIPLAGVIWLLVLLCMEGETKPNKWGDNPKGLGNDININQIGKE